jgi:hypothetical protein
MTADYFGLHRKEPTEQQIDAGAKALREKQQAGKRLNEWSSLPNSTKKKWRDHASAVLSAALNA